MGKESQNLALQIIIPVSYIIASYLIGLIFEKIVIKRLKKIPAMEGIHGSNTIKSSRVPVLLLFVVLGTYGAVLSIPLQTNIFIGIEKTLMVIGIILSTIIVSNIIEGIINIYSNKTESSLHGTSIFVNISRITVYSVGVLIMLDKLGISVTPILTALGVGGLAVALALKDTLTNLFSGLSLIASKQIKIADYIRLDTGEEGYITDITWRDTIIKTGNDNMVIIPNQKMSSAIITNFNNPNTEIPVIIPICVSSDCDSEKVEKVTVDTAKAVMKDVEGAVHDYEPLVRFTGFNDAGMTFNAIMRAQDFDKQFVIKHEFVKRINKEFKKEKIKISFPLEQGMLLKTSNPK